MHTDPPDDSISCSILRMVRVTLRASCVCFVLFHFMHFIYGTISNYLEFERDEQEERGEINAFGGEERRT